MNRIFTNSFGTPYEADFAQWCAEQGSLLRAGNLEALDRENLAEEVETLGRSEKGEIENRLNVLLIHLLKWRYQPSAKRQLGRHDRRATQPAPSQTCREPQPEGVPSRNSCRGIPVGAPQGSGRDVDHGDQIPRNLPVHDRSDFDHFPS